MILDYFVLTNKCFYFAFLCFDFAFNFIYIFFCFYLLLPISLPACGIQLQPVAAVAKVRRL